ncbi:MAG TPA: M20/M25/M40 family metallo-hydrolase [Gaiellaceae bacterium]|nr:M20/M25/M40 family metallo-hydrolase [Gaiellaceae bacterium]
MESLSPARRTTEAAGLLADLVSIDSVNPGYSAGGAGEAEIAAFVAGWLEDAGLEVEVEEAAPGRPNVVGRARGRRGGGRTLLLNGHTDTVGHAGMVEPLRPRVEGRRLYGRGACDMKAGLAAIMLAGAHAARSRHGGDVVVAAVVDEELSSLGTEAVAGVVAADAAVVAEPTDLAIGVAHRGFVWLELATAGRAAHGSRPDLGEDAIVVMGPVLTGLAALDRELRSREPHPLVGTASVHASTIAGGGEWSTYPDRCRLDVERRTLPGDTPEQVAEELRALLPADGSVRVAFVREPLETEIDAPIVRTLHSLAGTELVGMPFWTDAALFAAAGIPAVVFGPGGGGLHELVEWADLDQLDRSIEILCRLVDEFCA